MCFDSWGGGAIFILMVATTDDRLRNAVTTVSYKFNSTVTVKYVETAVDGLDCLKRTNVSMCIIDGELGDNGMILARRVREIKRYSLIPIIYVSEKMDNIIAAFKNIHCYDYFLKPVAVEDIYLVVKLFSTDFYKTAMGDDIKKTHILLGLPQGMLKVNTDEILMIEANRRKCIVHTCSMEYELVQSLNSFYEKVEQFGFIRAHRSYIINPRNVRQIDKRSDVWLIRFYDSDKTSPLSRIYKNDLVQKLSFLMQL